MPSTTLLEPTYPQAASLEPLALETLLKATTTVATAVEAGETRHKDKWMKIAKGNIAKAYKIKDPVKMPLARNKLINKAYAEIYFSDPDTFKWAGLAVFASHAVGKKMEWLRQITNASSTALIASFGTALPIWLLTPQLKYLYKAVGIGNREIYMDIYWQHVAYKEAGIEELEKIYAQGDITENVLHAWQMLDEGKRTQNQDLIWQANIDILEHEQKIVIQPLLYNGARNKNLWQAISMGDDLLRLLITSPVPEEPKTFRDCMPNSNLADVDARWEWCTKNIMTDWKAYQTKYPNRVKAFINKAIA